mgnify:CR=1 FL=1
MTELIRIRFFSDSVSESDSIRMEQLSRFVEAIPDHLWLGNGMGSYLPGLSAEYRGAIFI